MNICIFELGRRAWRLNWAPPRRRIFPEMEAGGGAQTTILGAAAQRQLDIHIHDLSSH